MPYLAVSQSTQAQDKRDENLHALKTSMVDNDTPENTTNMVVGKLNQWRGNESN